MLHIRRFYSSLGKNIRNVGIIAHIDAGKTTTTERILFDAGKILITGEVDKGTTTTDYLDEERKRGITIMSATANIFWKDHNINIIDTPGHVDFTLEVERALSVLDGTITILDATRGVQAQTMTVWNQAIHHKIPNVFYLNKFDRQAHNLERCMYHIKTKLSQVQPCLIQLPTFCNISGQFNGIIDVIELTHEEWKLTNGICTESKLRKLHESHEHFKNALLARLNIVENLANIDDGVIRNEYLALSKPELFIPPKIIHESLRKLTLLAVVSPVLVGSSKINIGITRLLDTIVEYLPRPNEKQLPPQFQFLAQHDNHTSGLVFKVILDKIRGPLTFLRLYSGTIKPGTVMSNITRSNKEKIGNILQMTGETFTELSEAHTGNIVAVAGLKKTTTGDFLVDQNFAKNMDKNDRLLHLISVPEPVIFAVIEPTSLTELNQLESVLLELCKEDPSLSFNLDEESHQLILGGMGSLHLEVVFERIKNDFQMPKIRMGKIRVSYKECPVALFEENPKSFVREETFQLTDKSSNISTTMRLKVNKHSISSNEISFENSQEFIWDFLKPNEKNSLLTSLRNSLKHCGPLLRSPLIGIHIELVNLKYNEKPIKFLDKKTLLLVTSAIIGCLKKLVGNLETELLEPMMKVEISFNQSNQGPPEHFSSILSDLQHRRAQILHTDKSQINPQSKEEAEFFIDAYIPLAESLNYSDIIRRLSSGNANLHYRFSHYDRMDSISQEKILQKKIFRNS